MNTTMSTMNDPEDQSFTGQSEYQIQNKTSWIMERELHSHHFLAQDLNNEASVLISKAKDIPRAIKLLVTALELSRGSSQDENNSSTRGPCAFERCSLDSCLFDEEHYEDEEHNSYHECYNCDGNHIHHQAGKRTRYQRYQQHKNQDNLNNEEGGFIYRRPIRVSQTSMRENHYMGSALPVIILFNLALANQLLGMSIPSSWSRFHSLEKAMRLYELCIRACDACSFSDPASLRLKLLVTINLGQIHKLCGVPQKYRMCLEYVLKAMMFVSHGREGGWDHGFEVLTSSEMDAIYRNMQSSSVLMGNEVHAAAA